MEDNVRFLNQLDKLLKQKTEDYFIADITHVETKVCLIENFRTHYSKI